MKRRRQRLKHLRRLKQRPAETPARDDIYRQCTKQTHQTISMSKQAAGVQARHLQRQMRCRRANLRRDELAKERAEHNEKVAGNEKALSSSQSVKKDELAKEWAEHNESGK